MNGGQVLRQSSWDLGVDKGRPGCWHVRGWYTSRSFDRRVPDPDCELTSPAVSEEGVDSSSVVQRNLRSPNSRCTGDRRKAHSLDPHDRAEGNEDGDTCHDPDKHAADATQQAGPFPGDWAAHWLMPTRSALTAQSRPVAALSYDKSFDFLAARLAKYWPVNPSAAGELAR